MDGTSEDLKALLARTAGGDHQAFEEVYRRTNAHLFGLALRMLGREQAAEDVLQDAFVSIWRSAGQYRPRLDGGQEIQPMTWLIAIVRNKALDALRSGRRRGELELPQAMDDESALGADGSGGPLELFDQAARALRLEACLGDLDGSHRQSLALAYFQGLTQSEVAQRMAAPLGSVKAWIRRGLAKLRACLDAQEGRA